MNVTDANGWYMAEPAIRKWMEDFVDEDTGDVVSIERNEIISPVGDHITPITIAMLQANGVSEVVVSNKKITGRQQKYMSLWQLDAVSLDPIKGKDRTDSYIIPQGSPLECEVFFREWGMVNISGPFTIKKVVPLDYSAVYMPYEDEIQDARDKHIGLRFYKAVLKSIDGCSMNLIVQADRINTVEAEVWVEYINKGHYDRISEIKEININKIFDEGLNVTRYSIATHNPQITSHFIQELDKMDAESIPTSDAI